MKIKNSKPFINAPNWTKIIRCFRARDLDQWARFITEIPSKYALSSTTISARRAKAAAKVARTTSWEPRTQIDSRPATKIKNPKLVSIFARKKKQLTKFYS